MEGLKNQELAGLDEALTDQEPGWILVQGPIGSGKSTVLAQRVREGGGVLYHAAPGADGDLLADFRELLLARLGEIPVPEGPGYLPDPSAPPGWQDLLLGLVDRARFHGRPLLVVLDGWDKLQAARKQLPRELAEALDRAERRKAPIRFVLTLDGADPSSLTGLPDPAHTLTLGPLSLRAAARRQGGRSPGDAFHRWALLGAYPVQFPLSDPGATWEGAVIRRVLEPTGDLHDLPLRQLREGFQRPGRYLSILRALARGPLDWSQLREGARAVESGGQMAPYLNRLEEMGLVVTRRPLGAPSDARNRRYRLADPFLGFWFELVLPLRSLLLTEDPAELWANRIRPGIRDHLRRWLPVAVEEWFRDHAQERFPAASRQVGGVWAGEAEFQVVSWLTNGQICYVGTRWEVEPSGAEFYDDLKERMLRTRYGIGREARTPVLVLPGGMTEELRRRVAADPLATVLGLEELMGSSSQGPEPGSRFVS